MHFKGNIFWQGFRALRLSPRASAALLSVARLNHQVVSDVVRKRQDHIFPDCQVLPLLWALGAGVMGSSMGTTGGLIGFVFSCWLCYATGACGPSAGSYDPTSGSGQKN